MLTGVILTGMDPLGASRTDAAEVLLLRQIRSMRKVCGELIVMTEEPRRLLPVVDRSVRLLSGYYAGKAPLAHLHAALSLSLGERLWVVSGSRPLLSPKAAERLLAYGAGQEWEALLPEKAGAVYPLPGLYRKACLPAVSALLEKGESRLEALAGSLKVLPVPERVWAAAGIRLEAGKPLLTLSGWDC
ncbi:NTP transferase domain-containing protein [Paenibacillus aurantius]|uniref:NTP transferase domain-containing protein n=1 Tax=Paenibacillus aurantius TaxID=2918900 RepID=A0AA96LBZ4_9BACL|nr:NTP transferase domain-containing protein [Paenibacillus aurantius]WNQ10912.1 NTP transferase domain-containing protein [Paenibacillus aurantius]